MCRMILTTCRESRGTSRWRGWSRLRSEPGSGHRDSRSSHVTSWQSASASHGRPQHGLTLGWPERVISWLSPASAWWSPRRTAGRNKAPDPTQAVKAAHELALAFAPLICGGHGESLWKERPGLDEDPVHSSRGAHTPSMPAFLHKARKSRRTCEASSGAPTLPGDFAPDPLPVRLQAEGDGPTRAPFASSQ
jgi:hypothetical protein